MNLVSKLFAILVALIHSYILWFEMFRWTERGPNVFTSFPPELFEQTQVLAANQGLYNGFLAAGLVWALCISTPAWSRNVASFFFLCVTVAGVYGAMTAEPRIFFVQALPAILGLISVLVLKKSDAASVS